MMLKSYRSMLPSSYAKYDREFPVAVINGTYYAIIRIKDFSAEVVQFAQGEGIWSGADRIHVRENGHRDPSVFLITEDGTLYEGYGTFSSIRFRNPEEKDDVYDQTMRGSYA